MRSWFRRWSLRNTQQDHQQVFACRSEWFDEWFDKDSRLEKLSKGVDPDWTDEDEETK